jgi:hypothetical protein
MVAVLEASAPKSLLIGTLDFTVKVFAIVSSDTSSPFHVYVSLCRCDVCAMPGTGPLIDKTIVKIAICIQCVAVGFLLRFAPPTRILLFAFNTHHSGPVSLSDNVATRRRCASKAPAAATLS